jgi:acyl carrier protein
MQILIEEIRRFVNDNFLFGQASEELADDDSFLEKGIIDSTGVLQLVGFIQQTYDIVLEDEDLVPENLDSVRRVAAFVERKLAAKPVAAALCGEGLAAERVTANG